MVTMEDKKKRLERKRSEVPGMVAYAYNPSIWELEVGGLGVQSQPQKHSEASLGYRRV